jgi:hypothetical protein
MAIHREHARRDVDALGCTEGIASAQLAVCLNVLRLRACTEGYQTLDKLPQCQSSVLCVR